MNENEHFLVTRNTNFNPFVQDGTIYLSIEKNNDDVFIKPFENRLKTKCLFFLYLSSFNDGLRVAAKWTDNNVRW